MANRTTFGEVQKISDTALADADITSVIDFANRIVTDTVGSESLSAAVLKDIETWLTAHLIAIGKERQPNAEKVGDIWLTFDKNERVGLGSTKYGQMVLFLDTSGKFQAGTMKKARIRAMKQIDTTRSFSG